MGGKASTTDVGKAIAEVVMVTRTPSAGN